MTAVLVVFLYPRQPAQLAAGEALPEGLEGEGLLLYDSEKSKLVLFFAR